MTNKPQYVEPIRLLQSFVLQQVGSSFSNYQGDNYPKQVRTTSTPQSNYFAFDVTNKPRMISKPDGLNYAVFEKNNSAGYYFFNGDARDELPQPAPETFILALEDFGTQKVQFQWKKDPTKSIITVQRAEFPNQKPKNKKRRVVTRSSGPKVEDKGKKVKEAKGEKKNKPIAKAAKKK